MIIKILKYFGFLLSGKKSRIKRLGQAGLVYNRDGKRYNVDSEIMVRGKVDLVISWKDMYLVEDPSAYISDADKKIIALEIVKELHEQGDIAELDPEIF